jgi:hypothetical protein
MTYVTAHRDASGRYPGIGIAYTKLTREECEALKNAKFSVRIINSTEADNAQEEHAAQGVQEATVIDSGTDFTHRIEELLNVGNSIPVHPVINLEELTYGTPERKYYVARISKVAHGADLTINLLNDIDFLVAGDIQVDPNAVYTVSSYNAETNKVTITPQGE